MVIVNCKICKKEFYAKPNWLKRGWGKYCSLNCRHIGQRTGKFVKCYICGKKTWKTQKALIHSKSGKFFCNKSHQTLWRNEYYSGERHPNWKNGNHEAYRNILIRNKVNPICKICDRKDTRLLIAHHKDKNRRNNSIKNLIWLCLNCHHLVHHYNKSIN